MKIFTRTHRGLWLLGALTVLATTCATAQTLIPAFKAQSSTWYIQAGLLVNATNGTYRFANPPAGPGPWCTPAEMILYPQSVRARDYPLCPGSAGILERTRHDSAPHADDVVPSNPWSFDISRSFPSSGPFAVEFRISDSRTHPGANHTDAYMAVVGALLGTGPGSLLGPRFVIIHGSMGKHLAKPAPLGPSPIMSGCMLQPPSGQPGGAAQNYPAGLLSTIVDPADGKLLLMLVTDGLSDTNASVFVRNGSGGPIVADIRPLMQVRRLNGSSSLFYVPDVPIQTELVQLVLSGKAVVSVPTTNHPDGEIVGQLRPISTGSSSYDVPMRPGWNAIANQLSRGSNTLAEVLPLVPTGSTFYHRNEASQTYSASSFDPNAGGWDNPSLPLSPGEGGFLYNPSPSPFTLTIAGETTTPHLPLSLPHDHPALVARQIPAPATYDEITGLQPAEGTKLYRYDSTLQGDPFGLSNWLAYAFSQGQWTPSVPSVGVGEPVFIQVPNATNPAAPTLSIQLQGSRAVVSLSGDGIIQSTDELRAPPGVTQWTRCSNLNPWALPIEGGAKFFSAMAQAAWPWANLIRGANGRLAYSVGNRQFVEIPCDNWQVIEVKGPPPGFDVQCIDPVTWTVSKTYKLRDLNGDGDFSEAGEVQ